MPAMSIQGLTIVATVSTPAHIHIQIDGLHWPSGTVPVASLALVFTIGSFWWLNGRRGRLKSFEPHSFALGIMPADLVMLLRFPLVFYNTGATPIIIQDMRLTFPKEPHATASLPWRNTRSQIMPGSDDRGTLPAVFSIPGRTAQQMFIEFGGPFPGVIPKARDYQAVIEVKLGHRRKWKKLISFTIRAAHITSIDHYIAYSNALHDLTPEIIAEAEASLENFARRRGIKQTANK
jgi:hypothetical protein